MCKDAPDTALASTTLESCTVVAHTISCKGALGELTLEAPNCALQVRPGQFVHLALPGLEAHLLRRPFSVYKANAEKGTITLLYQVVGEGSRHMCAQEVGAVLNIIGPVGTGWKPRDAKKCLLIGGGVGAAPLYLLAAELVSQNVSVDVVLGAATAELLACEDSFCELITGEQALITTHITTDDGSKGFKGFAPEKAAELMAAHSYDYLATCGPELMQKIVANLAIHAGVRCEVSLERRMACGIGACLSCVVDTVQGKRRACVDGPVFNAEEVCW